MSRAFAAAIFSGSISAGRWQKKFRLSAPLVAPRAAAASPAIFSGAVKASPSEPSAPALAAAGAIAGVEEPAIGA